MLIGITGRMRSGKDTAAAALTAQGWTRLAFADPLKEAVLALNPIVLMNSFGTTIRVAELVEGLGWEDAKDGLPEVRRLLQRMGTEAGRDVLGEDVWVNALMARYYKSEARHIVVTDVRFPNEADAIQYAGGYILRVERPGLPQGGHSSEAAMDDYPWVNHTIVNDGTVEDLQHQVREVARHWGADL